ncbi:lysozyme inhibitor LprI family protein [Pontibacter populi]|uniref:Lysozyme inhibitor LprI family protein n=1 Tax=Pontibacter populi TaxID=890055 RepID=A0ABV1RQ62_9BACT
MRTLLTIVFTLFATCSFAQTQAEMNQQAFASYQKVDKELNDVYKKLLTEYKSDPAFITNLKASQRIWITFRDAELKMKYPEREAGYYGSIHPICRASYLEELTSERIKQLRKWLAGVEEVDGCSGSIKLNE